MSAKTLIIVEGPNDASFIKCLLNGLLVESALVDDLEGYSVQHLHRVGVSENRGKNALADRLEMLKGELRFDEYNELMNIAIILDSDELPDGGIENSLKLVNNAFERGLGYNPGFTKEAESKPINVKVGPESLAFSASCFFMKTDNNEGHLDLVLKEIANQSVPECVCLAEQWEPCVTEKSGQRPKGFEKLWVNFYLRAHADKAQRKDAERRMHEVIEKKGKEIFDLQHPVLEGLRSYLKGFA